MKHHLLNKNVLITTSDWFLAPNGKQYKGIWGELKAVHEASSVLGFQVNRTHTNWMIEVGNMHVMGCRVMYLVECQNRPNISIVEDCSQDVLMKNTSAINDLHLGIHKRPSYIYNANFDYEFQKFKELDPKNQVL